jgi:PAS domain S-box-containing protein
VVPRRGSAGPLAEQLIQSEEERKNTVTEAILTTPETTETLELVEMGEAAKTSEELFTAMADESPTGINLLEDGVFIYANQTVVEMFHGETAGDVTSKQPHELSPEMQPDGRTSAEAAEDMIGQAIQNGMHRFEWVHRRLDGEDFWVEVSLKIIPFGDRQIVLTALQEISDRKEAEETIRKQSDAVAELSTTMQASERDLRTIFNSVNDGISICNMDGRVLEANERAADMFDLSIDELIATPLTDLWSPEALAEIPGTIAMVAAGEPQQAEWQARRPKDGSTFDAEVFARSITRGGEDVMMVVTRDITDRKEAEETIRRQNDAMVELSTPVITLWDQVVLMPLIGVVDTMRAQQIIEKLLESIVEQEAQVAILDVTGVPMIDTSVARHLLKTVEAAKMLGSDVVVTGFSADAAQTLAQLGIDFAGLRTRGSLRAGIAEAFALVGRQVTAR